MTDQQKPAEDRVPAEERNEPVRSINAQEIFQGQREVWIEHDGVRYCLRITRRNKLILMK